MGNNPVGKKINTPNGYLSGNTWVNTFLRKYLGIYLFM